MQTSVKYLRHIKMQRLGPIDTLNWELPPGHKGPGWHVFIGDNGAGTSTLLRAVALALIGPSAQHSLRFPTENMHHKDAKSGDVELAFTHNGTLRWPPRKSDNGLDLFHAGFGPTRRFSGDPSQRALEASDRRASRHASLFDLEWNLTNLVQWLKDLRIDAMDAASRPTLLSAIMTFLNQPGLLPHGAQFVRVTSQGPVFRDPNGVELGIEALSDGYQSVVGLTLELLRQMLKRDAAADVLRSTAHEGIFVGIAGIVLIDEIDAHLHPTWQQSVGNFLVRYFPNIQFLVSTHSPLVCRAAVDGTIFQLPTPGQQGKGRMVTSETRNRLLYGDVLDAYGTEMFGERVARSEEGRKKLQRLAELNVKRRLGDGLNAQEEQEKAVLSATLGEEPFMMEEEAS